MNRRVIPADDFSAFYMPSISAVVTATPSKDIIHTTIPAVKEVGSDPIALWGDSNNFPQLVIADVRKDPEIGTLLDKQARLLYSGGIEWGVENGTDTLTPLPDAINKEIKTWLRRTNINRYVLEAARDLYWFYNVFPEIVLSKDRSQIVQICVQPAEYCRWSKQNPNTGIIESCYINANFPDDKYNSPRTKVLPVIDPYYDPAQILREAKGTNFIYPLSYPTPGSNYYQLADWNSIRQSGWLAVSMAIPKFKQYLLEKQTTIKYHIEVSDQYWILKYPDWGSLTKEQMVARKEAEFETFQQVMAGAAQAGNNLFTAMKTDFGMGKEYSMWKINVIDDKLKSGQYLEEGKEASLYKMSAIGLHPALVGTMPNNGLGGAGSNIREAYNLHILTNRPHQDIILEPLYVAKDFNMWPEDMVWRFKNNTMNTLDKGSDTSKTAA